jgi:hypothetical protein
MSLSRLEQETIILFNEKEDTASVDTCNGALIRKLDKRTALQENKQVYLVREDEYGKAYVIPKSWVKVNLPPALTEKERAKRSARARAQFGRGEKDDEAAAVTGEVIT